MADSDESKGELSGRCAACGGPDHLGACPSTPMPPESPPARRASGPDAGLQAVLWRLAADSAIDEAEAYARGHRRLTVVHGPPANQGGTAAAAPAPRAGRRRR